MVTARRSRAAVAALALLGTVGAVAALGKLRATSTLLRPGSCPEGMVPIPAGTFTMGSDEDSSERPPHRVTLSAFCMDATEVTVAAYRRCTEETHGGLVCTPPDAGPSCNWDKPDRDDHPVNCVDWAQADAYCRWRGASLPTEAQWEYAARGGDGRTYPWGDASPSRQLCWDGPGSDVGKGNRSGTCPAESYPAGASPFGVLGMAGNVWEWVADWYGPYAETPAVDPKGPDQPGSAARRVVRGGSFRDVDSEAMRAAGRSRHGASIRDIGLGFRCARPPSR